MLLQQIDKLVQDTARRRENADYLSAELGRIPGIKPVRLPDRQPRGVAPLPVPLRREAVQWPDAEPVRPRAARRGRPLRGGYAEQYNDGLLDEAIQSRGFKRLFGRERLKAYRESFRELSGNRVVCDTTVAFTQNLLLADRADLDHIVAAVRKIHAHAAALAKAAPM